MDCPLPIGAGQTISQPFIVAFMTEILGLNSSKKVLEVGTGSGYQAAILSEIVGTKGKIITLDSLNDKHLIKTLEEDPNFVELEFVII